MDLSEAKDIHIGSVPVQSVWLEGVKVWERPQEGDFILRDGILLKDGSPVLLKDGTPLVMKKAEPYPHIGVLLNDGTSVPQSSVPEEGYAKELVCGIYYEDADCSFVIALEDTAQCYFCGAGALKDDPEGVTVTGTLLGVAQYDYAGRSNTEILAPLLGNQIWAVHLCRNHVFPDGREGYLGALGEYRKINENITAVNALLVKCGGTAVSEARVYWASTLMVFDEQHNTRWTWIWHPPAYMDAGNGQGYRWCRPLTYYKSDNYKTGGGDF